MSSLQDRWSGRRVLVTGNTGFKGAWLCAWLHELGADVVGYGLEPPTTPSLWDQADLGRWIPWTYGDIRDVDGLERTIARHQPAIVFHLAAQAIVAEGYADPLGTWSTNTMGTANLLEAVRRAGVPCGVVVVTTDKVYAPSAAPRGEADRLGGEDPYAASKAAAEMAASAWRSSFFPVSKVDRHGVVIATARAGNVFGPGDYAPSRLVPHVLYHLSRGETPQLRDPEGIRPWQHVLEPLAGYLTLGDRIAPGVPDRARGSGAWNFGPWPEEAVRVREVVLRLQRALARHDDVAMATGPAPLREQRVLRLSIDKAVFELAWQPAYTLDEALTATAADQRRFDAAGSPEEVRAMISASIAHYVAVARAEGVPWARREAADDPSVPGLRGSPPGSCA